MKPFKLYKTLHSQFGPQHWWPVADEGGKKPTYKARKKLTEKQMLEVCIGAILTQNTSWKNAEKAIVKLHEENLISAEAIVSCKQQKLASLIKPSGYYNQKAKRLKLFCRYLMDNYKGNLSKMFQKPIEELRLELLCLHGIGRETADSIILYAAQKPVFVVDAYTRRLAERFFGLHENDYEKLREFFENNLPKDVKLYQEFHALIVEFCKDPCRKKPLCGECFLAKGCRKCL